MPRTLLTDERILLPGVAQRVAMIISEPQELLITWQLLGAMHTNEMH